MSRSDDWNPIETEVKIGIYCTKLIFDVCQRLSPVLCSCCSHHAGQLSVSAQKGILYKYVIDIALGSVYMEEGDPK